MGSDQLTTENLIMKQAQVAMVADGSLLWRNNVGNFFQGKAHYPVGLRETVTLYKGDVVLRHFRVIQCGLAEGSSDLIGFTPLIVTPEMVGRTVAVFTSPEAKNEVGNTTKQQRAWIEMVNGHGGIAFAFRNEDEARARLAESIKKIRG
jgi:hypothetical protein